MLIELPAFKKIFTALTVSPFPWKQSIWQILTKKELIRTCGFTSTLFLRYNNGTHRGFWLPNSPPPPPPCYPPIPLEIFSYGLYFPIKQISLGTPCSLEFPVTFLGVGRDAFWNYTILLLLLNQKNWKRLCSCNQPLVIFFTS